MRGMPSRTEVVEHYAKVSGRQVDDLDYYLVLAKWKLAIVLEQGFQRAGDDEKLLAYGPVITRLMRSAAELAESTDYRLTCAPRSARLRAAGSRPRRGAAVAARSSAGQVRVRVGAAAVNFPDVLLVADQYQISVPPPFVPGSEFAGVIVEVADGADDFAVGDRVTGTGMYGAFAEEVAVPAAGADAGSRTASTTARRRPSASPTARRITRCARWRGVQPGDELIVLGAGGGVGLAAVQLGVQFGAAVTAVASSDEKLDVAAALRRHTPRSTIARAICAPRCEDALPGRRRRGRRPGRRRPVRTRAAILRRGGRFVTVGYASGVIPRIPLNLVLVKGMHMLGFQFQDVAARRVRAQRGRTARPARHGRVAPHVGAVYPLAELRQRCATSPTAAPSARS